MPTLAFPALPRGPQTIAWALQAATIVHQSPLSGSMRTISTPGSRWQFSAMWPRLDRDDRALVEPWLAQLNGRAGRFYFSPPEYYLPKGTATSGSVNGSGQVGSTLAVTLGAGTTLLVGDFFQVNNELKRMTASATADGAGAASLSFAPPLRASPASGAALTLTAPRATFMLMDDTAGLTAGPGGFADFTIDAVEAFL